MTGTGEGHLVIHEDRPAGRITHLRIGADGVATGYCGHVDLGTGIETALAQIVAEELDLPLSSVTMVLGDTALTPDQGPTIASETIQITAIPLRLAAAQARAVLGAEAARRLNVAPAEIRCAEGEFHSAQGSIALSDLLAGRVLDLALDRATPTKPVADYRLVGQPVGRRDLAAKVTGDFVFVQDVTVPDLLHGHVIRPPYAGRDSGPFVGTSLIGWDAGSVAHLPGLVAIVREADFLGVVATSAEAARQIAETLRVDWHLPPALPDMADLAATLRDHPSTPRALDRSGDFARGLADCTRSLARTYVWPYHEHGSIGPSCAVADWAEGRPVVWSGTQNPHMLQADLALLMGLDPGAIEIRRFQAAGCYGRNCADDVCGDALLLSRAVGRPVRVQLTRAQEHLWEPKGAAQLMDVQGGLTAAGDLHAYALDTWYPSNRGPNLALLLTGRVPADPRPSDMGDRTAVPPYRVPHKRITVHDMAPIVRAAWMRGVSALPNTFAHESFIDELAWEAGEDPVAFRLRHLDDPRQADLVRRTAQAGGWHGRTGPRLQREGRMAFGQGFAFATYVHGTFPGVAAASAAWVCDVSVDLDTGEVLLNRVLVGQDQGLVINPDGVRQQIHGNVIQTASRTLLEQVTFDAITPTPRSWATYPIQTFPEVPRIDTLLIERPGDPPLGVGESAAVPAAAAIANAIFDATGVRLREAPFTSERMRAALAAAGVVPTPSLPPPAPTGWRRRLSPGPWLGLAGAVTLGALALPLHRALPPTPAPAAGTFSPQMIARGQQLFSAGDCAVCHTNPGGLANAGGRPIETPFGTVYSTNLTSDPDTGLGLWSYEAFRRAMRQGISRDGHNLYPAFPYTAFAGMTEADLIAIYAYLQTLPAVHQPTPRAQMVPGANLRVAMAGWNLMFHDPSPLQDDPAQPADWNRGRYLVETMGHCGACHTPRNLLGAEKTGAQAYAGAEVQGWWAPALGGDAASARGWTQSGFYDYLRSGHAPGLSVASGPMAEVIHGLQALPDSDLRAMSVYLATLAPPQNVAPAPVPEPARMPPSAMSRLFGAACGSCHDPDFAGDFTAAQLPLAHSPALRAPGPATVERVLRTGLTAPAGLGLRDMPAFGAELDAAQIADLARYLRQRFAPDLPPWP